MRVCIVALDFLPFRSSGLSVYVEHLALGLQSLGHQVTVLSARRIPVFTQLPEDANYQLTGVKTLRIPVINPSDWLGLGISSALWLSKMRKKFEIVHFADVHFGFAYQSPFISSAFQSFRQRLIANRGLPYSTGKTDTVFRLLYYSIARTLERKALERSSCVIMPTRFTMREFIESYRLPSERAYLVYPGIDLSMFANLPSKDKARSILGLPFEKRLLLFVGFAGPRKGLEYLADALKRLPREVMLVIVGRWQQRYLNHFLKILGEGLEKRVILTGYIPEHRKLLFYAAADIFVSASLLEGFGIPLAEAMAAELPVVATASGAAEEVLGNAGVIVPPFDACALFQAIQRILQDVSLSRDLSRIGRERAFTLFDRRRMAREVEAVYELFLNSR